MTIIEQATTDYTFVFKCSYSSVAIFYKTPKYLKQKFKYLLSDLKYIKDLYLTFAQ